MSQPELLRQVLQLLVDLGIDYMVTGSYASSLQGEPRLTHDIDLVVSLNPDSARQLFDRFSPDAFYLSKVAIDDALRSKSMFDLTEYSSGDKVGFHILTDTEFDRSRFQRKQTAGFLDLELVVSSPEDTILQKLSRAKRSGGSEKHFGDALRVYEIQHGRLDQAYLNDWAERLGVVDDWGRLKAEADPL